MLCHVPDVLACCGPRGPYRGEGLRPSLGKGVDEAGDRRIGGNRAEDVRLGPQHRDVREAVPAQRDRQSHVQQDLARIVHRTLLPPRRQRPRHRLIQPGLADGLDQQHSPGLGHHRMAIALDADTRVRPDTLLHLRSASFLAANRTLDKSHRCRSGALLAFSTKHRTATVVKARG